MKLATGGHAGASFGFKGTGTLRSAGAALAVVALSLSLGVVVPASADSDATAWSLEGLSATPTPVDVGDRFEVEIVVACHDTEPSTPEESEEGESTSDSGGGAEGDADLPEGGAGGEQTADEGEICRQGELTLVLDGRIDPASVEVAEADGVADAEVVASDERDGLWSVHAELSAVDGPVTVVVSLRTSPEVEAETPLGFEVGVGYLDGAVATERLEVELVGEQVADEDGSQNDGDDGSADTAEVQPLDVSPMSDHSELEPYTCPSQGILFQYPVGTDPNPQQTTVELIDMVSGEVETGDVLSGRRINAIGYNQLDDYIYGWDFVEGELVRVGLDGTEAVTSGLGVGGLTGDVDDNGHFWLIDGSPGHTWYQVDLAPGSATYGDVLAYGPVQGGGIENYVSGPDWAYVPGTDALLRIMRDQDVAALFAFDRSAHTWTNLGDLGHLGGSNIFGAVYADPDGFLYGSNNTTGDLWRVDVDEVEATLFTDGPSSANNDGARCATAPIPIDFGDAPDSYGTLLASDGARHGIADYDPVTHTAPLMLGELIDAETDGFPSSGADGDDLDGIDDEDGVADPILINAGDATDVTVTVTNDTDEVATLAAWLDLDGTGTFDVGDRVTLEIPANSGIDDYELTFPAGTTAQDTHARFRLFPGAVADPQPTGGVAGGEVEDYLVEAGRVSYTKTITPDDVTELEPGDEFTYTVTVTNEGATDLTGLTFTDDLTEVLDDADYSNDAEVDGPGEVAYDEPDLTWTGDLLVGQSATVTYTVTIDDPVTGDGILVNSVVGSGPGSNCTDDPATDPACYTEVPQPVIESTKSSSAVGNVEPGDSVEYTIVVANVGHQAATNVTVRDDLSGVLDDATYNGDATATAGNVEVDLGNQRLTWNGPLDEAGEPGGSVTIIYSVTVKPADQLGDGILRNALLSQDCPDPAVFDPDAPDFEEDCVTEHDIEAWVATKSASSVGTVQPGTTVTYTLDIANVGGADLAGLELVDDLTQVLDDATYNDDAAVDGSGQVDYAQPELTWTGDLTVGETATVTYSVTVANADELDDGVLINAVTGAPNCPDPAVIDPDDPEFNPDCVHIAEIEAWDAVKTVTPGGPVEPGQTVSYGFTVTNLGGADLVGGDGPALVVTDDLSGVFDDAAFNDDLEVIGPGAASITGTTLTWEGGLLVGESATVTYSVTVADADDLGDGSLVNALSGTPNCPDPAITDPDDPGFDPDCATVTEVAAWTAVKTVGGDPGAPRAPGDTVEYTIEVVNTGNVAFDDPADLPSIQDDLSGVLDDATYNGDASATSGTVDFTEPMLAWEGELAVGANVMVTYSVTIGAADELGDGQLTNAVVGAPNCPDPAITDPDDPGFDLDCATTVLISGFTVAKSADAPDPIGPGDTVTYTIDVENTGGVDLTGEQAAAFEDDLSGVLDDATYNDDASATSGTVDYTEPALTWDGDLPIGATATITYTVTLDDPIDGDFTLVNVVTGGDCPSPPVTDPDAPGFDPSCVQVLDLPGVHFHKAILGAPSDELEPGETYEYVVTVTNTGQVDLDGLTFEDDLSDVLDDATFNDDAQVDGSGATTYDEPTLSWSGDLAVGEVASVTYTVTVDDPIGGDGVLRNHVVGDGPNSNCPPDGTDPDCVTVFPGPIVEVVKERIGTANPEPGDTVTYRITAHNRGGADAEQELIVDDLSGLLDTAAFGGESTATAGTSSYDAPLLSWRVDLAAGETAVLTYDVVVNDVDDLGDGRLVNAVVGGMTCPGSDGCVTDDPVAAVAFEKHLVAPGSGQAEAGDTLTYRITIHNRGAADLENISFTDDLTALLEHGSYSDDAVAKVGEVTFDGAALSWASNLDAGEQAHVIYGLQLDDELADDVVLRNVVVGDGPASNCPDVDAGGVCAVDVDISSSGGEAATPSLPLPRTGAPLLALLLIGCIGLAAGLGVIRRTRNPHQPRRR